MTESRETASADSLPAVLEFIDDISLIIDETSELVDWNQAFVEHAGFTDKQTAITTANVFPDDDRERLHIAVERALDTGSETITVSFGSENQESTEVELLLTMLPEDWTDSPRVIGIGWESTTETSSKKTTSQRERAFHRAYEIITDTDRTIDEKIDSVLTHVRETLDTEYATLSRVEGDEYTFKAIAGPDSMTIERGETVPLEWTYCERVVTTEETVVFDNIDTQAPELADRPGNDELDIDSFLGAPVVMNDDIYGTFCFYGPDSTPRTFSDWEITLVNFLSKWVSNELKKEHLSEEIHEKERERYEALVTQSSDGIVVIRDGKFDYVNDRYLEITGYERDKLIGESYEKLLTPEYCDIVRKRYERRVAGESPSDTYDIEIESADGERRILELSASRLPQSGETTVLANVRDVTQRKRREQAISTLQDATARIQQMETVDELTTIAIQTATDVLDLPHAVCWLHNEATNELEPTAFSDQAKKRSRGSTLSADGYEYDVFRTGDVTRYTPHETAEDESFETGVLLPLGDHGLLGVGHPEATEIDPFVMEVAETLADHITTVLDRLERTRELRESERQYRAIFNQTYQFMGLMEPDGTLVEANDTALEFGGLDSEDVIGEKLWDAYWFSNSEELQAWLKTAVGKAAGGEFVRDEISVRGTDREAIIDFSLRPVTDGNGDVRFLIPEGRDITELKAHEEKLRRERDHVQRTEKLADVGGWMIDFDAETIRWTDGARQLYDVGPEFDPSLSDVTDYFHSDDYDIVIEAITDCREAGMPFDIEVRMITATGRTCWVRINGEQVLESGSRKIRGVIADISDRKEREQRLMVLNRVLRHNLRNQLGVISGYADQLESMLAPAEPESDRVEDKAASANEFRASKLGENQPHSISHDNIKTYTRKIQQNTEELLALAEKAQAFEKTIQQVEQSGSVAVRPVILSLISEYEPAYPNATIETDIADITIWGNEKFLRQVVEELLTNALVHNDQEQPEITVTAMERAGDQVAITVADDGPGIPEMEREVLRSGEESPLLHGSGVGLWTVNWLSSRLGGQISIAENDSRGTVVTLIVSSGGNV